MCGIAGWLGPIPEPQLYSQCLVQALWHRGPDGHGVRFSPNATLVHTRLGILDLSDAGAQPMANEDRSIWVVFNGEIYNHREIRRDLESRGHLFKGRSDSEILPHLYEEEGAAFLSRLRGMFALAVYDERKRILILARDRFGIKPLFYAATKYGLVFASEIKALLELPGIDIEPDKQAVSDYAALLYIPAPETIYRGVRSLQAGELLQGRYIQGNIEWSTRLFHRWSIAPNPSLTLKKAADQTEELITAAVQKQLESDVPLGALLSGGIDSSLVSAAAQTALNSPVQTFNARFSEQSYDETWAALAVARHIGSDHRTLDIMDAQGGWSQIQTLLQHAGQPFADTSFFATDAICQLIRQYVTVALSGDGGDEAFGGYRFYRRIALLAAMQRLPKQLGSAASCALAPFAKLRVIPSHYPRRAKKVAQADDISLVESLFCSVSEAEHRALCRDLSVLPTRRLFERQWERELFPGASSVERLSTHATEVNIRLELANDFLFKVDTASMKHSLEVRVPMLDEDLFAFGLSLPHKLKVRHQIGKVVLREIARRKLPRQVAKKPKQGFALPVDKWVNGDFKLRLNDALLGSNSTLSEYFNPQVYRPIVEAFCTGRDHPNLSRRALYVRTIMLLSLQLVLDYRPPQKVPKIFPAFGKCATATQ